MVKDVWAIDCQLNKLKDFLSKIKDEFVFIRYSITILIRNTRLPDIKFK